MRTKFLIVSIFLAGIVLGWSAQGRGARFRFGGTAIGPEPRVRELPFDRDPVRAEGPGTRSVGGALVGPGSAGFAPFAKGAESAPVLDDQIWLNDQIWLIELGGTVYIAGPPP